MDELAERFEERRTRLRAVAYRILGSLSEADDAVQEAWLRLSRSDADAIESLDAWLTTVVARVSLNMLRARRTRGEVQMPEPIIDRAGGIDPEHEALLADSVGLALLVVLETLSPPERLAFVLHDIFAMPFDQIAPIVDRTPAAARQLASRARRRVQGEHTVPDTDIAAQREVIDAFLAAARDGDFEALLDVLDPDVVLRTDDGSGALQIIEGAQTVASNARYYGTTRVAHPVIVDGAAGLVATEAGVPVAVLAFTVHDGRITAIDALSESRVAGLGLEAFVAG